LGGGGAALANAAERDGGIGRAEAALRCAAYSSASRSWVVVVCSGAISRISLQIAIAFEEKALAGVNRRLPAKPCHRVVGSR
jgi:hypothetical protein